MTITRTRAVTVTGSPLTGNRGPGLWFDESVYDLTASGNDVVGNTGRPVWPVQDERVATDLDVPGHDPRRPLPDPTVTGLLGPVTMANNVIGGPTTASCLLCAEDTALGRTAREMGLVADGNAHLRSAPGSPAVATWPLEGRRPAVYETVADLRAATGQESSGTEVTGGLDGRFRLGPDLAAGQAGLPAGSQLLGAQRR